MHSEPLAITESERISEYLTEWGRAQCSWLTLQPPAGSAGHFQAVAVWREKPLKLTGTRSCSYLNVAKRTQFCCFSVPREARIRTNMKGNCLIPPGVATRRQLNREGEMLVPGHDQTQCCCCKANPSSWNLPSLSLNRILVSSQNQNQNKSQP